MQLSTFRRTNREFFADGAGPSKAEWCEWIERGVVRGKIICGTPYIDVDWFAASGEQLEPTDSEHEGTTALDLLAS